MNKKIKIITFISFFIIVSMVIIFGGVSLSTNKFVFSTRYYETPRKAFEKENSTIEIRKDINIFWFDEYNSFYIAETENNELLICRMFCKNNKFFYTGAYAIYNSDVLKSPAIDDYNENVIFSKKGLFEKKIFWKLLVVEEEKFEEELNMIYSYTIDTINYYVYFMVKED